MQLSQLGPYKIGRQLGRGGMGTVYAGINVESGDSVAVKVLSAALAQEEGFRERFDVEVETLKVLKHENIVRIFGYGEQDGVLFYSMEMVEGRTLEEELKDGRRFPWLEVKDIAVKICQALKHAHDRGVIHRDLKPANLMITPDGRVKLSDFGIAKLFGAANMTAAGGVVGTAEFMAPEQADGRPVGHKADLYSLGAVLYTLLARRPPFVGKSIPELLQMQRFTQPDPVRRYNGDVPDEIEAIVMELLEKDPERRPHNATIVSRRLEATALGLKRRDERRLEAQNRLPASDRTVADTGFDVGPSSAAAEAPPAAAAASDSKGRTLRATRAITHPPAAKAHGEGVDLYGVTQVTSELREEPPGKSSSKDGRGTLALAVSSGETAASRFVTVADEERSHLHGEQRKSWVSPQTCLLAAGLLAVGLAIYYFLQPPSADTLYERITERVNEQGDGGIIASEEDIELFMRHHPRDRRSAELQRMQQQIELLRLERSLERQARRRSGLEGLSLVELNYLEAMQAKAIDAATAYAKFQALAQMFEGGGHNLGKQETLCLKLAQRQAVQLRDAARQHKRDSLTLIQKRLDHARGLDAADPEAAAKIRLGLIQWYGDKPWAADGLAAAWSAATEPTVAAAAAFDPWHALALRGSLEIASRLQRSSLAYAVP